MTLLTADQMRTGTISEGTMRPEDLIPVFCNEIKDIRHRLEANRRRGKGDLSLHNDEILAITETLEGIKKLQHRKGYWESDHPTFDMNELFERLDVNAPDGFYFGAHPGDGADYGFWKDEPDENECTFPDCGCPESRLCMAGEPNTGAINFLGLATKSKWAKRLPPINQVTK